MAGVLFASASGLPWVLSTAFLHTPGVPVGLLQLGRVLLARGESLIATGALGWAMARVGPRHAGKVMVWIGTAIVGTYAVGAPLGGVIDRHSGFAAIALAIVVIPVLALAAVAAIAAVPPSASHKTPFYKVLGAVWEPGLGLALSSVGLGLITAFIALVFAARQWGDASLAFTAFGLVFIGARIVFGHVPDQVGGARVALVSVAIETVGQLLIWKSGRPRSPFLARP